jgi:hypothetical protein
MPNIAASAKTGKQSNRDSGFSTTRKENLSLAVKQPNKPLETSKQQKQTNFSSIAKVETGSGRSSSQAATDETKGESQMTILTIEFKKGSSQTWQKAPIQMRSNSLLSRKASQLAMLEGWTAWRIVSA